MKELLPFVLPFIATCIVAYFGYKGNVKIANSNERVAVDKASKEELQSLVQRFDRLRNDYSELDKKHIKAVEKFEECKHDMESKIQENFELMKKLVSGK